jgi:heat shock protein HslJ
MKNYWIALLLLGLVTCKAPETKTDILVLTQHVVGIYEASLPCADCISIEYQLELESDSSFVEHITFLGKPDGTYEVHGTWMADTDSVLTLNPGRLAYKLKVNENGTLTIVDAIENHLEQQPAILTRVGSAPKTEASILLNDTWVLEAIDQVEITDKEFPREHPLLEFHQADGKVMGTTGCNQFNGTYITSANNIQFGPLLTTKMACAGNGEYKFTQALQEVTYFKILDLKLYLLAGSTEKLRFRKVD